MSITRFCKVIVMTLILFIGAASNIFAQEDWIDYVIVKDKGVMSVSLDLRLDLYRPNYKNLLVVGNKFDKCLKNGFPTEESLNDIYTFSDSTAVLIDKITPGRLAGFMTYQCMAFDIYYVKDTTGLRKEMEKMVAKNFNPDHSYFEIQRDKSWDYYRNYLYPRDFSSEFLIDQDYLYDLVLQGDDLKGLRKVNHWIYFKSVQKRNLFGKRLKELKFSLDSIDYKKEKAFPFELKVSRQDSIDPASIYQLTSMLRLLSVTMKGEYDGWSTEVKSNDE